MGDVIDFIKIRRIEAQEKKTPHPILEALDTLAVALTDHGHEWTTKEKKLYEVAVSYIIGDTHTFDFDLD